MKKIYHYFPRSLKYALSLDKKYYLNMYSIVLGLFILFSIVYTQYQYVSYGGPTIIEHGLQGLPFLVLMILIVLRNALVLGVLATLNIIFFPWVKEFLTTTPGLRFVFRQREPLGYILVDSVRTANQKRDMTPYDVAYQYHGKGRFTKHYDDKSKRDTYEDALALAMTNKLFFRFLNMVLIAGAWFVSCILGWLIVPMLVKKYS